MNIRKQMEQIYKDIPLEKIPWNLTQPPDILVDAVETGKIKPCKTVDLGCGAGNYAVWFAEQGFDVTGIDISSNAIRHANDLATEKGVSCRFAIADLLGDISRYHGQFDFAYDWEVLHHIMPDDREDYLENVFNVLLPEGIYFSQCFSIMDTDFGGEGNIRKTRLGTILYFSSEEELRDLYKPYFHILELKTMEIKGKYGPHMANVAWLKRR
jgi:2-polyprenyl-3-methyl-5-hydroxy-6-metoxy-1,4-benzoquinol methylase